VENAIQTHGANQLIQWQDEDMAQINDESTTPACNSRGIADVFGSEHGVEALEQKEASLQ
jgi:hypothetical protein